MPCRVLHGRLLRLLLLAAPLLVAGPAAAQQQPASAASSLLADPQHAQLILVLPFDNGSSADPSVDWIGSAFPELMDRRFAAAGFLPISRTDRLYALDHLGLPPDFRPTHASALRLAQAVDASSVVLGTYRVENGRIIASARLLSTEALRMSQPIEESAELAKLPDVINALAWRLTRALDPTYSVAESTFLAADPNLRLDAFENYIRGVTEDQPEERLHHLREAVRLNAKFYPAWLALGHAFFDASDYDSAAAAFGHLTRDDPNALEADFYRGLAFFFTGKYLQAEDAWAFVTTRLPLPEVVNNQAVAAARRGKPAAPLFQEAITADPRDPDYHFNLAVTLARQGDTAGALRELGEAQKLRPNDPEAQTFAANLRNPAFVSQLNTAAHAATSSPSAAPAAASPAPASPTAPDLSTLLPLERIKRSYAEAGFRQAAYAMEQMEQARTGALPPAQRASNLLAEGDHYLAVGLLVEAERAYNEALAADPNSAAAHAGLAQIRERTGDRDQARSEAQRSNTLRPNVPAYLVLARLDLVGAQLPAAAQEVSAALRLAPQDPNARGLKQALETRGTPVAP
jgi:tetratricopeptide (TPR) repeat protein